MKLTSIYFLLILLAFSCKNKIKQDKLSQKDTTSVITTAPDTLHERNVMDGDIFRSFYKNGVKKMEGRISNGAREGNWIAWYEDGTPWSECEYKNGLREGKSVVYYNDGKKRYEGIYKNDMRTGTWIYYNPDGSVAQKEVN